MPKPSLSRGRTTDRDSNTEKLSDSLDVHLGSKLTTEDCDHCSRDPSRSKNGSDTSPPNTAKEAPREDSDSSNDISRSSSSTESLDLNSAEETWSEGSTDVAQLNQVQWRTLDSSQEESSAMSESEGETYEESETSHSEEFSEGPVHSYGQLMDESESDGGDIDFGCGSEDDAYQGDSDRSNLSNYSNFNDDYGFDSGDEDAMHARLRIKAWGQRSSNYPEGCLMIYDLRSNPPTLLFRYLQALPLMLYDSPPAIHPTKPLVVWPLFGGDILFADFEAKSYFTRRARPSTRRSMVHLLLSACFGSVLTTELSSARLPKMQFLALRTVSAHPIPGGTRNAPLHSGKKETYQTLSGAIRLPLHPPPLNAQNHPQPAITRPPR